MFHRALEFAATTESVWEQNTNNLVDTHAKNHFVAQNLKINQRPVHKYTRVHTQAHEFEVTGGTCCIWWVLK